MTVFIVDKMVAATPFTVDAVYSTMNLRFLEFLKTSKRGRHITHELSYFLFVLFGIVRFVKDVVFLTPLIDASEAIVTADAVGAQRQAA